MAAIVQADATAYYVPTSAIMNTRFVLFQGADGGVSTKFPSEFLCDSTSRPLLVKLLRLSAREQSDAAVLKKLLRAVGDDIVAQAKFVADIARIGRNDLFRSLCVVLYGTS